MTAGVWGKESHFQSASCSVQHHDSDFSKLVNNFGCIKKKNASGFWKAIDNVQEPFGI